MKKILFALFGVGLLSPFLALADGGMMGYGSGVAGSYDCSEAFYGHMAGWSGMMGLGGGFSWVAAITWIVWTLVGVFLAVYLWQKISKK